MCVSCFVWESLNIANEYGAENTENAFQAPLFLS